MDKEKKIDFKVGSVVYMKSGSPKMTIVELNEKTADLRWFAWEGDGQMLCGNAPLDALVLAAAAGKGGSARAAPAPF